MAAALAKAREKLDRMRKAGAPKRALKAREEIVQGLDNRLRETRAVSERGRSRAAASRREQRRIR
jgi:hypothetical protein